MKLKLFLPLLIVLAGCATGATKPQDIISLACAPSDQYQIERCAEAVGDVYGVFQSRALKTVSEPGTPAEIKNALKKVDKELTPAVRTLVQTSNTYVLLRDAQSPEAVEQRRVLEAQLADVKPRVVILQTQL